MKTKLFFVFAAVVFAFSVVSCGNKKAASAENVDGCQIEKCEAAMKSCEKDSCLADSCASCPTPCDSVKCEKPCEQKTNCASQDSCKQEKKCEHNHEHVGCSHK